MNSALTPEAPRDAKDLQFFGKVNASISHELKNILAIISETTGFLDDLIDLSRKGNTFDLSILEKSNKSIAEEIQRGFHTIRQMNKFAHTVDHETAEIDVKESLELGVNLAGFLSSKTKLLIEAPPGKLLLQTNPFSVINLIYTVLRELCQTKEIDEIKIRPEKKNSGDIQIFFSVAGPKEALPNMTLGNETAENNMALQFRPDRREIQLTLKPE